MIEEITIKNFALLEDLTIEPIAGFNVITGETGAGKSVFLEALRFLFGASVPAADFLRPGASYLEASTRCRIDSRRAPSLSAELAGLGIEPEDGVLVVRRQFEPASGRSKAFCQDRPVAAATLKKIASAMMEVHGQGDSSQIYDLGFARAFLDLWAGLGSLGGCYQAAYEAWRGAEDDLAAHRKFVEENRSRLDYLRFTLEEIRQVKLDPETMRRLQEDLPLWMSREKTAQAVSAMRQALSEAEPNAMAQAGDLATLARQMVSDLSGREDTAGLLANFETATQALAEASRILSQLEGSMDFDPAALEELLGQKAKLSRLLAKHRCDSWNDLAVMAEKIERDAGVLENSVVEDDRLAQAAQARRSELDRIAGELTALRKTGAAKLGPAAAKAARALGLAHASLRLSIGALTEPGPWGRDEVAILFEPNPGEGERPLNEIASGGEASRVALALKGLLLERDEQPGPGDRLPWVLILDEIEQGLSARACTLVEEALARLGGRFQIFAITHSPAIALAGRAHFYFEKIVNSGRTWAVCRRLEGESERREEALRLLGAMTGPQKDDLIPYVDRLLGKKPRLSRHSGKNRNPAALLVKAGNRDKRVGYRPPPV